VAVAGLRIEPGYVYYRCSWLADNLCAHHSQRPPICRGFPHYEAAPTIQVDDLLPTPRCGYHSSHAHNYC
jgi:Fe-S-cluster containining protein